MQDAGLLPALRCNVVELSEEQLLRYSRQIMLAEIDAQGQLRLAEARILIVGLGGLGSPAAMYLATAGVGCLVLCDDERVELSNLQRQVLYDTRDLGELKSEKARARLHAINPDVDLCLVTERIGGERLSREVAAADVVLDATDNFATRFAINAACLRHRKPMVFGAAIRFEGQVSVFDARDPESPCYRCLYSDNFVDERESCEARGVLAPLLGVIGSVQAIEAIKLVTGSGEGLCGRLLLFDALGMTWHSATLKRDPQCPACRHAPSLPSTSA